MNGATKPLSDAILERFALGELPPRQREELSRLTEGDPSLQARIEGLRRSDREILDAHPTLAGLAEARGLRTPAAAPSAPDRLASLSAPWRRLAGAWSRSRGFRLAVPGIPALAALALLAILRPAPVKDGDGIRLKGTEASLAIFRKTPAGTELLPPHSLARPGDTLQLFYRVTREQHAVIFSLDGNGVSTLHLPEASGPAALLDPGEMRALPHAYLLDRAPRMERFYLVASSGPFSVDSIVERARAAMASGLPPEVVPGLPEGFRQSTYTLRKQGRGPRKGGRE